MFPTELAAEDVRARGGSRVSIRDATGFEIAAEVTGADGESLVVEIPFGPDGSAPALDAEVVVAWSELNDLAEVDGRVVPGVSVDQVIECTWPPRRVQRRAFRRAQLQVPAWVVRNGATGEIVRGRTRDLSGAGLALQARGVELEVDEPVVVMMRLADRDLLLPSTVNWSSLEHAVHGIRFERITQPDQDHLVQLVNVWEASRG